VGLGCGHGYWVQKVVGSSLNGVLGMLEHYTTDFFFLKQAITFLCLWINLGVDVCICIRCLLCYHDMHDFHFFLLLLFIVLCFGGVVAY
jgi:hypothetical protein